MATGTGNLPYITDSVSPFDIILAETQNEHIANIQSLADGSGIGDGAIGTSTLANSAVTEEKQVVKSSYSTSEVNTGFKWVDGKTIYKKTINFGALPDNTTKNVAHGVSGIDKTVRIETMSRDPTQGTFVIPMTTGVGWIWLLVGATNISVATNANRTNFSDTYITMYYTKT